MSPTSASAPRQDVRGYISDMLAQLADLAASDGAGRLERALRLLALEAAAEAAARPRDSKWPEVKSPS